MINHVSFGAADFGASRTFYDAVLGTLGYRRLVVREAMAAWGQPRPPGA